MGAGGPDVTYVKKLLDAVISRWLLVLVILFGIIIRLGHLLFVDVRLPFYGGGLYLLFAQKIRANHYMLPSHIPYITEGGIPYGYPPLPFWIEALIIDAFSLSELSALTVVTILPPLVAIMALLSFPLLAREMRFSRPAQLAAVVFYTAMPSAWKELIQGSGLAEAFGSLALIWFAISLAKISGKRESIFWDYIFAGLMWGLCLLASPGSAYASLPMFVVFAVSWLIRPFDRARQCVGIALISAVGVLTSAPWWVTVLMNHGFQLFIDVLSAEQGGLWATIWRFASSLVNFSVGKGGVAWDVLIYIGALWTFLQGEYLLCVWLLAFLMIPRESSWLVSIPGSMLGGLAIGRIFYPWIQELWKRTRDRWQKAMIATTLLCIGGLSILWPIGKFIDDLLEEKASFLSWSDVEALGWIAQNAPEEVPIVALRAGVLDWGVLAHRTLLNTPFGAEWKPEVCLRNLELNESLKHCCDLNCILQEVERRTGYDEMILYMSQSQYSSIGPEREQEQRKYVFKLLWENDTVVIGYIGKTDKNLAPALPPGGRAGDVGRHR